MLTNTFVKFQGAGNDFILIDDRALLFDPIFVAQLCHRKHGIGADGLIILQNDKTADFRMKIYNSDGSEAESCGNGLRCLFLFLLELGFPRKKYRIRVGDRIVEGEYRDEEISIQMGAPTDLRVIEIDGKTIYSLNTGVPHLVVFVPDVQKIDLMAEGAMLRHHPYFKPRGTNVNFVSILSEGSIHVRTFERGVEGETLACGTGATAVGMVCYQYLKMKSPIFLHFKGGKIEIDVRGINDVRMSGPAEKIFEGTITLDSFPKDSILHTHETCSSSCSPHRFC